MLLQICRFFFLIWIWSKSSKEKGKWKLSIPKLWSSLDTGFGPAWHATTDCFGTEVVIGVYSVSLGKGWCFRKQLPDTQVAKYCHLWGDLQMIAKGVLKLRTIMPKSKCWMITLNWKDAFFSLNGMGIRAVFFTYCPNTLCWQVWQQWPRPSAGNGQLKSCLRSFRCFVSKDFWSLQQLSLHIRPTTRFLLSHNA